MIFGKKVTEHEVSVLILSKTFLTLKTIQRDIVINAKTSSCKVPLLLFFILIIIQRDIVINVKTSSCKVPVILVMF